jgi:lysophospholipase L1-like esterase
MTGSSGAAGAVRGSGWRRCACMRTLFAAGVVALAAVLFPAPASAQELDVQAGHAPDELRCPVIHHRHRGRAWRRKHSGAVMEMPGSDDLVDLPSQVETQHQDVVLQGGKFDGSRPFAMALWGDSHAASDFFSDEMMRTLGVAPDGAQPTFIPATMGRMGVRLPVRKFCLSDGWKHDYDYVTRASHITATKGLGDISTRVRGSYLWMDFRASPRVPDLQSLDVLFAPPAPGSKVRVGVTVDGDDERVVELDPAAGGVLQLKSPQPMSVVRLRLVAGAFVLQGFAPHYVKTPSVYFDTFAIPGATAHAWKVLDPAYLRQRGSDVNYDLIVMEYGTNEGNDRHFDPGKYEDDLRGSLRNLRLAYPDAMCALVGPPDRGVLVERPRGRHRRVVRRGHVDPLKFAHIHERIGEIQRAVGKEFSCAYWSWQDAMGGPGAAYGWRRRSPALMGRDLTHLTMPGYQLSARLFTQDIGLSRILGRAAVSVKADATVPASIVPAALPEAVARAAADAQAASAVQTSGP